MTIDKTFLCFGLALATMIMAGCGQKEQQPTEGGTAEPRSSVTTPDPAGAGTTEQSRPLAETAQQAIDKATEQAQALIEQTRTVLNEQDYAGAASGLEKLAEMSLTPEQEELVKELKAEAVKLSSVAEDKLGEVKTLVDEKKYQEASAKLAEMANINLTPEQQELVDKLKAEIQKGLSGQAIESGKKTLGGLLEDN